MRERWLVALACGFEVATVAYALIRTVQAFIGNEPNPATVIASVHAGFFWRAWTSAYIGGFAAILVILLARSVDPIARFALRALPFAAVIAGIQAIALP